MLKTMRTLAFGGLFSAAAIGVAVLPMTIDGAAAATKKNQAKSSKSSMKKGGAMKSGNGPKGDTGDPLNAAAGKKM